MLDEILKDADERMKKAVASLAHSFSTVRTGRASAAILEGVEVDYYGVPTPLQQLANISAPEPQLLVIQPYDKSSIGAIERAILGADLGLNPANDGNVIRVPFPPLTEERRLELVKLCRQYAEEARVAIRNIRRDANDKYKKAEKEHEISQDDLHRAESEVQELTDKHIAEVDKALEVKEAEIMEV
ncbi:MAG: ribosome recycling factor [Coriobacteriia bacterium]